MPCNSAPAASLIGSFKFYIVHREKVNNLPTLKFKEFTTNASCQNDLRERNNFDSGFLVKIFSDTGLKISLTF